jgi:hypothetical protein
VEEDACVDAREDTVLCQSLNPKPKNLNPQPKA